MNEQFEQQQVSGVSEEPGAGEVAGGSLSDPEAVRTFAVDVARSLRDDKCEDIVVLDVRGLSNVTDYVVIGSGTSQRQMGSALQHVEDLASNQRVGRLQSNRDDRSLWLLADFVDVVVHLFEPNTRAYYDLEMLWGDAVRVDWNDREEA